MEQREVDNMLLSMIQKHFPALPLSDEYTDWGKWLGFARAAYEAGRASPASASVTAPDYRIADRGFRWDAENRQHIPQLLIEFTPVPANEPNDSNGWKDRDNLAAMLASASTPPVSEDRKDAERYRVLKSGDFSVEKFVSYSYGWKFVPMEELDAAIDAAMQEDKP